MLQLDSDQERPYCDACRRPARQILSQPWHQLDSQANSFQPCPAPCVRLLVAPASSHLQGRPPPPPPSLWAPQAPARRVQPLAFSTHLPLVPTDPPPPPHPHPHPPGQAKTTWDILRQLMVFQACKIRPLVTNADALLAWSKRVLGEKLVYGLIRPTFYKQARRQLQQRGSLLAARFAAPLFASLLRSCCQPHVGADAPRSRPLPSAVQFVAGETLEEVVDVLAEMAQHGVGGITVFESGSLASLPLLGVGYITVVCCADIAVDVAACLPACLAARPVAGCR